MTAEEMAEEYAHNHIHYEVAKREDGTEYAKEVSNVTIKQAYLAGLKAGSQLDKVWHDYDAGEDCYEDSHEGKWVKREAGKPKWHKVADGDLPSVHATFLNENCEKVEYLGEGKWEAYSEYYEEYVEVDPPIAWCEIPQYTEDKE